MPSYPVIFGIHLQLLAYLEVGDKYCISVCSLSVIKYRWFESYNPMKCIQIIISDFCLQILVFCFTCTFDFSPLVLIPLRGGLSAPF